MFLRVWFPRTVWIINLDNELVLWDLKWNVPVGPGGIQSWRRGSGDVGVEKAVGSQEAELSPESGDSEGSMELRDRGQRRHGQPEEPGEGEETRRQRSHRSRERSKLQREAKVRRLGENKEVRTEVSLDSVTPRSPGIFVRRLSGAGERRAMTV